MRVVFTAAKALGVLVAMAALASASRDRHAGSSVEGERSKPRQYWPKPAAGPSASGDPELVLTFDDGPHEELTPLVLDELRRRNLKATFFWVGHRVSGRKRGTAQRRALVLRAIREGHLVGNHTINHAKLCAGPRERAEREIDDNVQIYEELTDMPLEGIRVPYGANCARVRSMLADRGLTHLHWDFDPKEWEHHNAARTKAYVIGKLQKLEGRGVLLMHDTKRAAVTALPEILDWIEAENLRRAASGGHPIRIISYAQLARERVAPGLLPWLDDARARAVDTIASMGALVPGNSALSQLGSARKSSPRRRPPDP